ncbi:MAG: protocatechuate 3,4-dioxygenase [Pseudomonadota bacterium]
MLQSLTRRALLGLAALSLPGWAQARTPAQTAGPFYPPPDQRFADDDWDLVKIEGAVREAGGEILHLSGRVLSEGQPLEGARVEIWQCDATGQYLHSGDRGPGGGDPAFQGYGQMRTGPDGAWRFRTIRPVAYPGRTPHIHARVTAPGRPVLTTQFYVAGEPLNARDVLYRRLGAAGQAALTMELAPAQDGSLAARIDFLV